jgi:hypothetical protein
MSNVIKISQNVTVTLLSISVLMFAAGCRFPTAPGDAFPTALLPESPAAPAVGLPIGPVAPGLGSISGAVTINGESGSFAWVELQQSASPNWASASGTTNSSGSWVWEKVRAGDYFVVLKTPPGLTCDATRKSAAVEADQRTIVNFACVGDLKSSILGVVANEFGVASSARVTLTGPVNRETISNRDGFFAFDDLPPGEYLVGPCNVVRVSVREGVTGFAMVDCS